MDFKNPYWSDREKVEMLQRWILVHSYIYYFLNDQVVSDKTFDNNCRQLLKLKDDSLSAFEESSYFYAFRDFDGSTGYHLTNKLNEYHKGLVVRDSINLLGYVRER